MFKAWVDTRPLHSLGLTVEHQQQADGLRLTEQRQEERHEAKRGYEEDFRCDVDEKLWMNAEDMFDRHCSGHHVMFVLHCITQRTFCENKPTEEYCNIIFMTARLHRRCFVSHLSHELIKDQIRVRVFCHFTHITKATGKCS